MVPLILLAPSEDKAPGGPIGRLIETPAQHWVRERLMDLVVHGGPEAQKQAFQVKEAALEKAKAEALALRGPVHLLPALQRYTGVAFEALDAASLPRELWVRVFVLSNLRGLVRGDEPLPPYKLKLSGLPGLKAHWRKALPPLLEHLPEGETWELLPQDTGDLLKGWTRPRHTLEILDSRGKPVSHWSKKYRGLVARWILEHSSDPKKVMKAKLPGCRFTGSRANELGGRQLSIVVEP